MYGLLDRDVRYIFKALKQFEEIESVILFGSRAMGNFKKGSDVDIAICGNKITDKVTRRLDDLLNEVYPLPYFFDILHYEQISNPNLIEHINSKGKILYPADQQWFWTDEWQAGEHEAQAEIEAGKTKHFDSRNR